eukprot:gene29526-39135_t
MYDTQSAPARLHYGEVDWISQDTKQKRRAALVINDGLTCLQVAVSCGHYSAVEFLLWSGANISGADQVFRGLAGFRGTNILFENESSFRYEPSGQGSSADGFACLKKQVEARLGQGDTPAEVFSLFDSFNTGNIDLLSLQKGSENLGLTFTQSELRSVLLQMSLLADGTVDLTSFYEALKVDLTYFSTAAAGQKDKKDALLKENEFDGNRNNKYDPGRADHSKTTGGLRW